VRRTSATDVDALLAMGAEHAAFERAAFDAEADALASRRAGYAPRSGAALPWLRMNRLVGLVGRGLGRG